MMFHKKLYAFLFVAAGLVACNAGAISFVGFDVNELAPWIERAKNECNSRVTRFEGVSYKILFKANKEGIKNICIELKQAYKEDKAAGNATWYGKKQLYKAFKKGVYKVWKKTQLFPDVTSVALKS